MNNEHIVVGHDAKPNVVASGYYDQAIAETIDRRERDRVRRDYNRLVKTHGGSWKCRGGCGKTISANKMLCANCAAREYEIEMEAEREQQEVGHGLVASRGSFSAGGSVTPPAAEGTTSQQD